MLTMEANCQNPTANSLQSNAASTSKKPPDQASLGSIAQTRNANGGDWQEEVYQKGMDNNNWRAAQGQMVPPQGQVGEVEVLADPNAAPLAAMETGDWRTQLQPSSRQRIVNKM